MSRPSVRIVNDSVSESVDLLQMLIAPPPPPPPPSGSRPAAAPRLVHDGVAAPQQRPRAEQPCYQACHACAEELRYRQLQQQQQECAYCACSQPRVDPRPELADRDDTTSIYFNPRGPPPPGVGAGPACTWPRRPPAMKVPGPGGQAPREEVGGTSGSSCTGLTGARSSARRGDEDVDDIDDYDDATGKRTMSTSLSSRSSSRIPRLRSAADICRRAAVVDCCLRCWPRRRASTGSAAAPTASTVTDVDLYIQAAHGGRSESATAAASAGTLGRKSSSRHGLRCATTTRWNVNDDRRRTILLVVGFLVGLFLVSTVLLTAFVLLWPSQRRRHSTSGIFDHAVPHAHPIFQC